MASAPETTALNQLLDPLSECLTPEAAKGIAEFRADAKTQARIDELADKCTEGELTDEERQEYDAYVRAIDFITILQLKAQSILEGKTDS